MNPNNTDYSIFSACLRNTNATNTFLTFRSNHSTSVYILPEYYSIQVSENTSSKTKLPELCQNRLQIRNLPNVFSGDILTKFTQIFFQKRENFFCSFYYQSNDSAQRLEMPQNCDKPASSSHFAIQLHIVFAARW